MAEGDINYLSNNNNDCEIEASGVNQRAMLVATPNGFGGGGAGAIASTPFVLAVQQGRIPGYSVVDKFGENPDIDTGTVPEDIWEYGGIYPYDPINTAPIISIVSDNALDTQTLSVQGLDIDGNETSEDVVLTGTTRVALSTPLWRIFRIENNADEGEDINGTVYCYTGTGNVPVANEIRAIVDDGNNQTLMALYTIPLGYVGYLFKGEFGGSRSVSTGSAQNSYYSRRVGKVFKIKKRVDVAFTGNSNYIDVRSFPDPIPALTDIKLRTENVTANSTGMFGAFDILLVENSQLDPAYLTAIGQPTEMPT